MVRTLFFSSEATRGEKENASHLPPLRPAVATKSIATSPVVAQVSDHFPKFNLENGMAQAWVAQKTLNSLTAKGGHDRPLFDKLL